MITSLSYVGFSSPAADEWRSFGPEVLGAQLVDRPDGSVALRFDDHAARVVVSPGEANDITHIGWDCIDQAGLDAAVALVRAAGLNVADEPALASERQVEAVSSFTDPFGFRHELSHGLARLGPFVPGRDMTGRFITGDGGLGHLVFMVPDLDAAREFYVGTLGFRVSDHIEIGRGLRFLHCNSRHHTVALSEVPGHAGVHHLMLEVSEVDDVGRALDIVNERDMTLAMSLGRHTNDLMTSFYVRTPSGFEIEYGTGGVLVDDDEWEIATHDAMSIWGHKPPAERLVPGLLRRVDA